MPSMAFRPLLVSIKLGMERLLQGGPPRSDEDDEGPRLPMIAAADDEELEEVEEVDEAADDEEILDDLLAADWWLWSFLPPLDFISSAASALEMFSCFFHLVRRFWNQILTWREKETEWELVEKGRERKEIELGYKLNMQIFPLLGFFVSPLPSSQVALRKELSDYSPVFDNLILDTADLRAMTIITRPVQYSFDINPI